MKPGHFSFQNGTVMGKVGYDDNLPASPMMSRVVRLIHERHSMGATPSCLTISLLQMSRNYKGFTIMDYECFIK